MIKCKDCEYWKVIGNKNGNCKRHAPSPTIMEMGQTNIIGGKNYAIFQPVRNEEDECGDGTAREAA